MNKGDHKIGEGSVHVACQLVRVLMHDYERDTKQNAILNAKVFVFIDNVSAIGLLSSCFVSLINGLKI